MGCGSTKVIPESPFEDDKKSGGKNGKANDHYHQAKKKKTSSSSKDAFINAENAEKVKQNNAKNVGKYRAKFDPRVVSKYEIKALIGRGSFSHVVRVQHKGTGQQFAIKMIDVKQKEGRDVCESELRVLRRVRHPYIVQLVEVFEAPDKFYMVMELATGGELFDRIIARGSFSERDAVKVLQMVLEGVRYLHSLGITHRDLKPENLLYFHPGPDSKILLTDFGLASSQRSGNDVTMTITCGTPEYIAPEVLLRKPYTSAVDSWALGVITYILLSGTMPFDHEDKPTLYRTIIEGKYSFAGDPWPQVSQVAKDFVKSFLTVYPEERMSPAVALKHPWIYNHSNQSNKNLVRSISQNILKRASSRNSNKSAISGRSVISNRSLRSQHRKVSERLLLKHLPPSAVVRIIARLQRMQYRLSQGDLTTTVKQPRSTVAQPPSTVRSSVSERSVSECSVSECSIPECDLPYSYPTTTVNHPCSTVAIPALRYSTVRYIVSECDLPYPPTTTPTPTTTVHPPRLKRRSKIRLSVFWPVSPFMFVYMVKNNQKIVRNLLTKLD